MTLLRRELEHLGGHLIEIDTKACKASQYDHTNGICTKKPFRQRWAHLSDGSSFQRDICSAGLIAHVNEDGKTCDIQALKNDYAAFRLPHVKEMQKPESS